MHELALTSAIVEMAEEAAAGARVVRVTLVIGRLSGAMPEAIRFCFDEVARGTAVEGAALAIIEPEGRARCEACGAEFTTPDLLTACECGSLAMTRLAGDELTIDSIEVEEAA